MGTQRLDAIDVRILKTLLKDARASFTEIAKDCNVSTNVIAKRFQRLKRLKIITGTAIVIDLPELEPKHKLAMDLKVESNSVNEVLDELRSLPNFRASFRTVGPYDVHAAIGVDSLFDAEKIRSNLKRKKGVLKVVLSASLDTTIFLPENLIIEPTEIANE